MSNEINKSSTTKLSRVLVSQGTRCDAKPATNIGFETYREEMDSIVDQKRRIEVELGAYCRAAFSAEQSKIRREHRGNENASFEAWMRRKSEMETKRQELIRQKNFLETEITRLRPLVKSENLRGHGGNGTLESFPPIREDGSLSVEGVSAATLVELREVRVLLVKLIDVVAKIGGERE